MDPDPGGPKTYGSYGFESGSATLVERAYQVWHCDKEEVLNNTVPYIKREHIIR
jgi:hypothetical protein